MKVAFAVAAVLSLVGSAYAAEATPFHLENSPLDFAAPAVYGRTNIVEAPVGAIVYDASTGSFYGLSNTGAASVASSWVQIGGTAGSNSVSTSGSSQRIEQVTVAGTCSANPCTITSNTPAVTSVNWNGPGSYQINFQAGTFSAPPTCAITAGSTASGGVQVSFN